MSDEADFTTGNIEHLQGAEAIEALEAFQVAYTRANGEPHKEAAEMLASMRKEKQ